MKKIFWPQFGWISPLTVWLCVVATALAFYAWFSRLDVDIYWYFMRNHTGYWQHFYDILSRMGQAWFQQLLCAVVAAGLACRMMPKKYAKYGPLSILIFYVGGLYLFMSAVFGKTWSAGLGAFGRGCDWFKKKVDEAPKLAQLFALATPLYLIIGILSHIPKMIIGRPRPKILVGHDLYWAEWFEMAGRFKAFPSGHAITTFALLSILWPHFPRWRWAMLAVAIIVVLGRIGIGSHWFGDVVMACAMGYFMGRFYAHKYGLDDLNVWNK